ncbi:hypothetical protein OH705_27060, partial [Pseudomonas sp. BJa3]|nr:hypothetical protein [Pseudomonas sp. BJa3]
EISRLQLHQLQELRILDHELRQNDIEIVGSERLSESEKSWLEQYFFETIYPVLKPFPLDSSHSFPFIPNLGLSLALQLSRCVDQHTHRVLLPV